MQIIGSDINLASSYHRLKRDTFQERLEVWTGNRTPQDAPGAAHGAEPTKPVVIPPDSNVPKTTDTEELKAGSKYMILKLLIEKLTGKTIKTLNADDIANPKSEEEFATEGKGSTSREPASQEQPAGWGVSYDYHESHYESQTTTFSAQGIIRTADGKNISFALDLAISSESYSETNLSLRAGDAKKVDPLVINFNGPASELTDTKFAFDLTADGTREQVPFVKPGSGFLAFDRNGDGVVNNGTELFGPTTGNGFKELSAYDSDGNGWIEEKDPVYKNLLVWTQDSAGSDHLSTLKDSGIGALYLGNLDTKFDIKNAAGQLNGELKRFGLYVLDNDTPTVGTLQQIDLVA